MSEGVDMNSPAETHFTISPEEWMNLSKVALWHDYGDPGLLHNIIDEYADALIAARVAVVRPTRPMVGTQDAPVVSAAEASAALDSIAPRRSDSQPVRPTRSEIEELIATHIRAYACRERDAERLAVALLASFGVAVSDSQETPAEGREE